MDRKRNEIARSLSMVTQLGISMLAPLILCVCVGIWLDDTFGWSTTAVLVVLGSSGGSAFDSGRRIFLEIYVWVVDWSSYSDRACCPYVPLY